MGAVIRASVVAAFENFVHPRFPGERPTIPANPRRMGGPKPLPILIFMHFNPRAMGWFRSRSHTYPQPKQNSERYKNARNFPHHKINLPSKKKCSIYHTAQTKV